MIVLCFLYNEKDIQRKYLTNKKSKNLFSRKLILHNNFNLGNDFIKIFAKIILSRANIIMYSFRESELRKLQ